MDLDDYLHGVLQLASELVSIDSIDVLIMVYYKDVCLLAYAFVTNGVHIGHQQHSSIYRQFCYVLV